jgi:hypothetical protein
VESVIDLQLLLLLMIAQCSAEEQVEDEEEAKADEEGKVCFESVTLEHFYPTTD